MKTVTYVVHPNNLDRIAVGAYEFFDQQPTVSVRVVIITDTRMPRRLHGGFPIISFKGKRHAGNYIR